MILEEYKGNKKEAIKELTSVLKNFFNLVNHDECLENQNRLMHEFSHSEHILNDKEYIETIQISLEVSSFLSSLYKKYKDIENAEKILR